MTRDEILSIPCPHIGEVANIIWQQALCAVAERIPADDAEPVAEEWLRSHRDSLGKQLFIEHKRC